LKIPPDIRPPVTALERKRGTGRSASSKEKDDTVCSEPVVVSLLPRLKSGPYAPESASANNADQILESLRRDLPALGQNVGDLHQFADRRRILALLAPLVE